MCFVAWFLYNILGFAFFCQRHCRQPAGSSGSPSGAAVIKVESSEKIYQRTTAMKAGAPGPVCVLWALPSPVSFKWERKLRASRKAVRCSPSHSPLCSGSSWVSLLPPLSSLNGKGNHAGLRASFSQTKYQVLA